MKNIFSTNDEKITEKAFSQSLIISVLSILLCIVVLCSLTYAWFTQDVSSNTNKLQSGHFDFNVSVIRGENDEVAEASENTIVADASGAYTLDAVDTYTITLELTKETTAKGYCIVTVNGEEYRTEVIVNEQTKSETYPGENAPFTFKIKTTEANTTVKVESRWGVPADSTIEKGDTLTVEASQISNEEAAGE